MIVNVDPPTALRSDGKPPVRSRFLKRISPVAFAALTMTVVFVLYQFVAGGVTLLLGGLTPAARNVTLFRWGTFLGQGLCIFIPTLLLARWRGLDLRTTFRVRLPEARELVIAVVAVFALQQVLQGYLVLQDAIPLPPIIEHYVDLFKRMVEETYRVLVTASSPAEFVLVVCTVALAPAVCEEFLFRGLVQSSFAEVAGQERSALLTGIIFGAYHLNPFGVVPLVVLGSFFGFLVYRSRSIFLAVAAHFFNNFIAVTATYLRLSDDFLVLAPRGGASVSTQVLNFSLAAALFAVTVIVFLSMTEEEET